MTGRSQRYQVFDVVRSTPVRSNLVHYCGSEEKKRRPELYCELDVLMRCR